MTAGVTDVSCPRCVGSEPETFTERGAFAAHLVEDHGVSASVALAEARKAFGITAPALAVKAALRPGPVPPVAKETPMAKKKRQVTCRTCGKLGHLARRARRAADPPARP